MKTTISTLMKLKLKAEKISVLTAYDSSFTLLTEAAGIEVLLVGDSLGMVIQGQESTLPVTVDEMVYHTANVTRVSQQALIIADMPFMSHGTFAQALETAGKLMKQGGAHMVKIEGGAAQLETIQHLTERAVPVCGHLGLMPQSIHQLGAYRVQGKEETQAASILNDAIAIEKSGAQMLVLECVPAALAKKITDQLAIPVIGIGAGVDCDGQVLVLYDMLNITCGHIPSFSRNFMDSASSISEALSDYVKAVKDKSFPTQAESF